MARLARLDLPGHVHLVLQRGRPDRPVFVDDVDRRRYVELLGEVARVSPIAIHAFGLSDDEIGLLLTPAQPDALGRFMQRVGRRYVSDFHARHGTSGTLWPSRFQAAALDPEHYLLTGMLYVEQAPVRAGAVALARDWAWSSAQHHVGLRPVTWLREHPAYWRLGNTPFEREARHEAGLQPVLDERVVGALRKAVRGGWPLGSEAFVAAMSQLTNRPAQPRPRGRPRGSPSVA